MKKLNKYFIPIDYELDLFRKMQGLKQAGKSIQDYTEEFYQLNIWVGHVEGNKERLLITLVGYDLAFRRS